MRRANSRTTSGRSISVKLSGVEDAFRVELRLDALHNVERAAVLGTHVARTHGTGAVLARDRASDLDREAMKSIGELVRAPHLVRVVGVDEDRRVNVPIAEVAVEDDRDTQLGGDLASPAHRVWDLGERD